MTRKRSEYMCQRCGLALTRWHGAYGWKHVANRHTGPACRGAVPVNREQYERETTDLVAYALRRVRGDT